MTMALWRVMGLLGWKRPFPVPWTIPRLRAEATAPAYTLFAGTSEKPLFPPLVENPKARQIIRANWPRVTLLPGL